MKPSPIKAVKAWAMAHNGKILKCIEPTGYGNLTWLCVVNKPNQFKDQYYKWVQVEIRPLKPRRRK